MDTDIDRQIEAIKKLIPAASGDRLTFLTRRLVTLLMAKETSPYGTCSIVLDCPQCKVTFTYNLCTGKSIVEENGCIEDRE
jgi:hypothetical protein